MYNYFIFYSDNSQKYPNLINREIDFRVDTPSLLNVKSLTHLSMDSLSHGDLDHTRKSYSLAMEKEPKEKRARHLQRETTFGKERMVVYYPKQQEDKIFRARASKYTPSVPWFLGQVQSAKVFCLRYWPHGPFKLRLNYKSSLKRKLFRVAQNQFIASKYILVPFLH